MATTTFELSMAPADAFGAVLESLRDALGRRGIAFETTPGAEVHDANRTVGRVTESRAGERIAIELGSDGADPSVGVQLTAAPGDAGAVVTYTQQVWASLADDPDDVAGWAGTELLAPLLSAATPGRFQEWLTDRRARRPSGASAREAYRDPIPHLPNFGAILHWLDPGPQDRLLEVGCGGGVLLPDALKTFCTAAAIDHSPTMIALAQERNAAAIAAGRLRLEVADAARLPFESDSFTVAAMTSVLGLLSDPVTALAEIRRTLRDGGRLVVHGSDPAWRGTPAAPEPIASRMHFYTDAELTALGRRAGFADAQVRRIGLAEYARAAGLPEEYVPMYESPTPFLLAGFADG